MQPSRESARIKARGARASNNNSAAEEVSSHSTAEPAAGEASSPAPSETSTVIPSSYAIIEKLVVSESGVVLPRRLKKVVRR